jgi:hypothetical protein
MMDARNSRPNYIDAAGNYIGDACGNGGMSKELELESKKILLHNLQKLEMSGMRINIERPCLGTPLWELQYEYEQLKTMKDSFTRVSQMKNAINIVATVIKVIGTKLSIRLEGWDTFIAKQLEEGAYDMTLEQIYRNIFGRKGPPSPWMSIALLVCGSACAFHWRASGTPLLPNQGGGFGNILGPLLGLMRGGGGGGAGGGNGGGWRNTNSSPTPATGAQVQGLRAPTPPPSMLSPPVMPGLLQSRPQTTGDVGVHANVQVDTTRKQDVGSYEREERTRNRHGDHGHHRDHRRHNSSADRDTKQPYETVTANRDQQHVDHSHTGGSHTYPRQHAQVPRAPTSQAAAAAVPPPPPPPSQATPIINATKRVPIQPAIL